jgi:folate-binding protein YgfZ
MTDIRFCADTGLGLVRVSGKDARAFLHAQTTQRLDDLDASESRLAAWLNAKGRVRALFDVVADGDAFWLILPREETDYLIQGLKLFVLRADVQLEAPTDRVVASVIGPVDQWLTRRGQRLDAHGVAVTPDAILVRSGAQRIDLLARPETIAELSAGLDEASSEDFELVAVRQQLPAINASTRETYIPQMLSLERLGAVSFDKGCYPGQEIVARTQNLGSVKRRLKHFKVGPGPRPESGSAVVTAGGDPAGETNRVARSGDGFEVLAVVTMAEDELKLASDGRALHSQVVPEQG